jgi:hypothetical protein
MPDEQRKGRASTVERMDNVGIVAESLDTALMLRRTCRHLSTLL